MRCDELGSAVCRRRRLGTLSGCKGSANDPAGITEVSDAPAASVPSVSQSSGPKPTPQDVNPNTKVTATPQRGG